MVVYLDTSGDKPSDDTLVKMDLTFSGAGFMGNYYFGVVDCWDKYIPRERVNRVAGASAGSLIAAYYLLDLPMEACVKEIVDFLQDIRSRPLGVFDRTNQVVDVLPRILDELFPEDAHKRLSGRLYVCMTRLKDMKKVIISEFESKKHLIDALNCSCFIPVWSGNHTPTYKDVKHIDGGFTDNLPSFDEHTIRVCCFSGDTDISPLDRKRSNLFNSTFMNMPLYLNLANLRRAKHAVWPPHPNYMLSLMEQGFHDTKNFILSNDLIQCDACYRKTTLQDMPLYSKLTPTISPAVTPTITPAASHSDLRGLGRSGEGAGQFLSMDCASSDRSSFRRLLHDKLHRHSPAADWQDENNNRSTPTIVVSGEPEEDAPGVEVRETSHARDAGSDRRRTSVGAGKVTLKRNSVQASGSLLTLEDKFRCMGQALPSCPPSPNLNRHCADCIRLRQQARLDAINETLSSIINKYRTVEPVRAGLRSKITSPIRWLRHLAVKSSYQLQTAA